MPVTRFTVCVLFWPGSLPTPNRQSVYKGVFLGVLKTFAPVALLCWSSVDRQVCFPQRGSLRRAEGAFLGGKHGGGGGQANRAPAWLEIEFSLPAAFFFFLNLIISFSRNVPQDEVRAIVPLGIRDPSACQAIISK